MDSADAVLAVLAELDGVPSVLVEGAALDLVELVVGGALAISGFPGRDALATPDAAVLPVPLRVPAAAADAVRAAGRVVLEDAEGVPVALVEVTGSWSEEVEPDSGGDLLVAGPVRGLRALTHGPFRALRRSPAQVLAAASTPPKRALAVTRPLTIADVGRADASAAGEPLLVFALVGTGRRPYPDAAGLVQALRASLPELPAGSMVVPVPLPALDDPRADAALVQELLTAYGIGELLELAPGLGADEEALDRAVQSGELFAEPVLAVLAPHRPPLDQRGVVLLFSGLSGSGKSTVAKGVADALLESTTRTLTLLDGDVVRRNLSKGLGFSRADRDLNVRRIGFVAAEVARHGGIAICAPIAPYAATRAAVRDMVTEAGGVFLLVHVATPIEVCEARDRKGLYALARAGTIPEFTGVSDPYEVPDDADLRLDTSLQEVDVAVDAVLELLKVAGLVPAAQQEREED